ncbi:MAG TPA: DUF1571 domain-containing protein [Pirellulaceae bacterium]
MTTSHLARREFLRAMTAAGASCLAAGAYGSDNEKDLHEPVHRVAKANNPPAPPIVGQGHPLDPALDMAREALKVIEGTVTDYSCRIVKQERIKGELQPQEFMDAKIRNRKMQDGKIITPLSVYMKFVQPDNVKGREVVWVEGKNNNKLRAHEGGAAGRFLPSVWLDPDGALAMRGQLHPIYDIGVENLVLKLIERGQKELKYPECEVNIINNAKINGRVCTVLQVMHPVQRPHFEFYKAEIFVDDQLKFPVRYAAYYWPAKPGDPEPVLEAYTYLNVKTNVGLKDADFDSENPNYNF